MNKLFKRIGAMLLVLVMLLSVTGCGKKNNVTTYRGKLNVMLPEVVETADNLQATIRTLNSLLESGDKAAYEASLAELQGYAQKLIDDYHALANVAAPEQYQEKQKQLKTYADDVEVMLSNCVRLYTLLEESITSFLSNDTVEQIKRLEAEMEALTVSSTAYDAVLNEILGIEEDDSEEEKKDEEAESSEEEVQEEKGSSKKSK